MPSAVPNAPGTEPDWVTRGEGFITVSVLVRPRATQSGLLGVDARGLIVAIRSPPEKGQANDELIAMLACELKVARSSISIVRGARGRHKLLRVATTNSKQCAAVLAVSCRRAEELAKNVRSR